MKTRSQGIVVGLLLVGITVAMAPQMARADFSLVNLPTRDGTPAWFMAYNGMDPDIAGNYASVPRGKLIVTGSGSILVADGTNHPPEARSLPDPLPPGTVQYDKDRHPLCVKTAKGWVNVLDAGAPGFYQSGILNSKPAGTYVVSPNGVVYVWDGKQLTKPNFDSPSGTPQGKPHHFGGRNGPHRPSWLTHRLALPPKLTLPKLSLANMGVITTAGKLDGKIWVKAQPRQSGQSNGNPNASVQIPTAGSVARSAWTRQTSPSGSAPATPRNVYLKARR